MSSSSSSKPGKEVGYSASLDVIDGLFQEVEHYKGGHRLLCHLRRSPAQKKSPTMLLTVSDAQRVWSTELDVNAFKRHRTMLKLKSDDWRQIFLLVKKAFLTKDTLKVEFEKNQDAEKDLVLSLNYLVNPQSGLVLVDDFELVLLRNDTERIAELSATVFSLFSKVDDNATAKRDLELANDAAAAHGKELDAMRKRVKALENQKAELLVELERAQRNGGGARGSDDFSQLDNGGWDDAGAVAPPRIKPVPKPKNVSLVTGKKQRKRKGIQLG